MKIVWGRSIGWNLDMQRIQKTQIITDGAGCYPWTAHFAWWPVTTVSGQRAWGIKLYKRRVWVVWGWSMHMEPEVQYATLFDILEGHDDVLGNGH